MEPFTVGALGALTATEGIKFLYGQAAEILSRWRERRAGRLAASTVDVAESDAAVIDGRPTSLVIDFDAAMLAACAKRRPGTSASPRSRTPYDACSRLSTAGHSRSPARTADNPARTCAVAWTSRR